MFLTGIVVGCILAYFYLRFKLEDGFVPFINGDGEIDWKVVD